MLLVSLVRYSTVKMQSKATKILRTQSESSKKLRKVCVEAIEVSRGQVNAASQVTATFKRGPPTS